jgi:adenylate cyclase
MFVSSSAAVEELRQTEVRASRAAWLANAVAAFAVFNVVGVLVPILLEPGRQIALGLINAPVAILTIAVCGLIADRLNERKVRRATAWIERGEEPSDQDVRRVLALPLWRAKIATLMWVVTIPIFFAVNLSESLGFAVAIIPVIALGALTNGAVLYLLSEKLLRPVIARALSARLPKDTFGPGVRGRLVFAWGLGTGIPLLGIAMVAIVVLADNDVETAYAGGAILYMAAIALTVGLITTLFAAKAIADPIVSVRGALERVQKGDLDAELSVEDGTEVGLMQAGFNRMAEGLRERERIRDIFGRQVGRDVAEAALEHDIELGGEEREIAAFFVDIVGSTTMAVENDPTTVVERLNEFFAVVIEVTERHGGFVNKFEGDAALCVFGAPVSREDPAADALAAARELCRTLSERVPALRFGIGVSAGRAVAGNVGAEERFEYTVIGDPVNEAARLSDLAKERAVPVLASGAALEATRNGEARSWEVDGAATLRGRGEPTPLATPAG